MHIRNIWIVLFCVNFFLSSSSLLSEENNEIVFQDPRPARMMDFQRSSLIADEYFSHHPKVGELLLFPSWLPHFVSPNTSDQNRISISFNVELIV